MAPRNILKTTTLQEHLLWKKRSRLQNDCVFIKTNYTYVYIYILYNEEWLERYISYANSDYLRVVVL